MKEISLNTPTDQVRPGQKEKLAHLLVGSVSAVLDHSVLSMQEMALNLGIDIAGADEVMSIGQDALLTAITIMRSMGTVELAFPPHGEGEWKYYLEKDTDFLVEEGMLGEARMIPSPYVTARGEGLVPVQKNDSFLPMMPSV